MPVITNPYRYAVEGGPPFGNASREFDGASNFISIGPNSSFSFDDSDAFSVAFWIRADVLATAGIVGTWDRNSSKAGWYVAIRTAGGNRIQGGFLNSSGSYGRLRAGTTTISTNTWYHFGFSNAGNSSIDGISLYLNGALEPMENISNVNDDYSIGDEVLIGRNTYFDTFYDGRFADVRIYDAELSSNDFSDLASGVDVQTNLIGWWLTDTDDVLDYSGNGNNGTNNGSTYLPSGPFGVTPALPTFGNASRDFESSETDYISITTGASNGFGSLVGSGNGITLAAWVKLESGGTRQVVLGDWNTGGTGDSCVLEINSSNKVQLYIRPGGQYTDLQSSGTLNIGQWHHVAVCYYYGSGVSVFLDGVETVGPARSGDISLGTGISIGKAGEAAGLYFDGLIADARFYNRGLSAAEISSIISGTHITTGLVGHWLTDEFNYTDIIVDYSGNGNDGTNNGSTYSIIGPKDNLVLDLDAGNSASYSGTGTTWSDLSDYSNSGTLVNGVGYSSDDGGSLVFDGVDDWIDIPNNSLPTADYTINCWVKTPGSLSGYRQIISTSQFYWYLATYNNQFTIDIANGIFRFGTINVNTWYNVAVSRSGGINTAYINAVSEGTHSNATLLTGNWEIGRWASDPSYPGYWNSNIAKVQIYNRALSELEIQQNFELYRGRYGI